MKVLIAIFITSVIVFTFFGKLKVQEKEDIKLSHRFLASLLVGAIMDLVIGLPILGLLSLFGL